MRLSVVSCSLFLACCSSSMTSESPPAGASSILTDIARELMSRTGTNSQVLSLNLTNVIILVALKALLYGASLWGSTGHQDAGHHHHYGHHYGGRSLAEHGAVVSEAEVALLVSYLMGDEADHSCLHHVACIETAKAKQYLAAANLLINAAQMFNTIVPFDSKYEDLWTDLKNTTEFGENGGNCDIFSCISQKRSHKFQ